MKSSVPTIRNRMSVESLRGAEKASLMGVQPSEYEKLVLGIVTLGMQKCIRNVLRDEEARLSKRRKRIRK